VGRTREGCREDGGLVGCAGEVGGELWGPGGILMWVKAVVGNT